MRARAERHCGNTDNRGRDCVSSASLGLPNAGGRRTVSETRLKLRTALVSLGLNIPGTQMISAIKADLVTAAQTLR